MPQKGPLLSSEEEDDTHSLLPPRGIRTIPMTAEDADYPAYGLTELIDPEEDAYDDVGGGGIIPKFLKKHSSKTSNPSYDYQQNNLEQDDFAENDFRAAGDRRHRSGAFYGADSYSSLSPPDSSSTLSARKKCFIILAVTLVFLGAVVAIAVVAYTHAKGRIGKIYSKLRF